VSCNRPPQFADLVTFICEVDSEIQQWQAQTVSCVQEMNCMWWQMCGLTAHWPVQFQWFTIQPVTAETLEEVENG
jgi:hypothetical protein